MSPEDFERFLNSLSSDAKEAECLYTRLQERLVGFFTMKGVADSVDAAYDTLDRAAVKICGGAPVPDVSKFCLGIARNVVKERLRRERREGAVFLQFIENLNENCDEEIDRIYRVLKPCFEQLADEDRNLLSTYHQILRGRARAEHRRCMAEAAQTSILALRMRVTRLRSILTDCARRSLAVT